MTTTTTAPVSRRRVILTASAAFAGGAAIAAPAVAARAPTIASGAGLSQLLARRTAIIDFIDHNPIDLTMPYGRGLSDELNDIEANLFSAAPQNKVDIIVSLRFLRTFVEEGYEFDDDCTRLLDAVIAGVGQLGGVA